MSNLVKITAEQAVAKLTRFGWMWDHGYWKPSITADPTIIPGHYTMEEALALHNYEVEED
jgi:hypothetical protein